MLNLVPISIVRSFTEDDHLRYFCTGEEVPAYDMNFFVFVRSSIFKMTLHNYELIYDFARILRNPVVVGMNFDDSDNSLIIAFRSGEIYGLSNINVLAYLEVGRLVQYESIDAIEWSPDRETIAIISNDCLYLLSSRLVEVACYHLSQESPGEAALVNVGWGKKETQFQGSLGKEAAKEVKPFTPSSIEDKGSYITWRGDAALLAVSFLNIKTNRRQIKIIDAAGVLQSTNEELSGLEGPISWQPNGSLIAFCQRLTDKYYVSFLEKNGLKHGNFDIPSRFRVKQISWNVDSLILALLLTDMKSEAIQECMQMWSCLNYTWDMKYEITFSSPVTSFSWDDKVAGKCHVGLENGKIFFYMFEFLLNSGRNHLSSKTSSLVVTTSGVAANIQCDLQSKENDVALKATVRMTLCKDGIVPPPLSHHVIDLPKPASLVLFPSWSDEEMEKIKGNLSLVLVDQRIFIYSIEDGPPTLIREFEFPLHLAADRVIWFAPDLFLFLSNETYMNASITIVDTKEGDVLISKLFDLGFHVISMCYFDGGLTLQDTKGKIIEMDLESGKQYPLYTLPEPCSHMEKTKNGLFSLSNKSRLYWNAKNILTGVSSFLIHEDYLLITTIHDLKIFRIVNDELVELPQRKIEQGSKIVVAFDISVVLLHPRGNLETIQPRALSVMASMKLINNYRYKKAVNLLRKERIHLNLLIDHDPEKFLNNVNKFVTQVKPDFLSLFIAELNEDNVTRSHYPSFYEGFRQDFKGSKVATVCNKLIESMCSAGKTKYAAPILCAFIKTEQMQCAFEFATSDELFKQLLDSMEKDKLYKEALGVYNLDIAHRIAKNSQMDPKEYEPELNELRGMDQNYMKYIIDTRLNKPLSALNHISKCCEDDKFEECLRHIKKCSLHAEALLIFGKDSNRYDTVCSLYGDLLSSTQCYEESGILFQRTNNWEKALLAFSRSGNWRKCTLAVAKLNDGKVTEADLEGVISCLKSSKKFEDLGDMYFEILQKYSEAADFYISGKEWKKAIFLIRLYNLTLKESSLNTAIEEFYTTLTEEIQSAVKQFDQHLTRLKAVKNKAEKKNEGNFEDSGDTSDDASVVSLISRSGYTSCSSTRSSRKALKKMWNLKKGNPREEISLIRALNELMEKASSQLLGDVKSLCAALIDLEKDRESVELQNSFDHYLNIIEEAKSFIWPESGDYILTEDKRLQAPPKGIIKDWNLEIFQKRQPF